MTPAYLAYADHHLIERAEPLPEENAAAEPASRNPSDAVECDGGEA
ncbi:hypothetical protein [Chitinimonas taiwanensis]